MNKHLLRTLNLCACLFIPLAAFPLLVVYHAIYSAVAWGAVAPVPLWVLIVELLACEGCGLLGRLCGGLADRAGMLISMRRAAAVLLGVLPGAAGFLLFCWWDPDAAWGMAVFCAAAFWLMGGLRFRQYGELLSLRVFYGYLIEYLILLSVLEAFQVNPTNPVSFAAVLFVGLLLVLFGMNQSGIDFMMQRRRHHLDALPQKIRGYNIRLLLVAGGVLLLLLLLYRPIAELLSLIGGALLALLRWLLSRRSSGGGETASTAAPEPEEGGNDQLLLERGTTSPFWTYFGIAMAVGLALLIFFYRHEIYCGLRDGWRALRDFLRRMLWGGKQGLVRDENEYYVETDEIIESGAQAARISRTGSGRRQWRRACRQFASMEDSPESLRAGYGLILQGIALQGIPVEASDTTLELCGRAKGAGLPPLSGSTDAYNDLRYGEKSFDLRAMDGVRGALEALLKVK